MSLFGIAIIGWMIGRLLADVDGFFDELGQWDAAWYRTIAQSGYGPIAQEAIRFFALFPAMGAAVDFLAPWSLGVTMLLVAWTSTYLGLRRTAGLAKVASSSTATMRISIWSVVLWPASISLIMAYPTGITLLATSATLMHLTPPTNAPSRAHSTTINWARVATWSAVASLARPTGLLLAVPILLSLIQEKPKPKLAWLSIAAPLSGAATMSLLSLRLDRGVLAWSDVQAPLRGDWVNPISRVVTAIIDLAGRDFLDGLHLGTVAILITLTLVAWRHLPVPWAAHATAVLLVMISVENWNSLERYAYDMPQLAVAAAVVLQHGWKRRIALISWFGAVVIVALVMSGDFVP